MPPCHVVGRAILTEGREDDRLAADRGVKPVYDSTRTESRPRSSSDVGGCRPAEVCGLDRSRTSSIVDMEKGRSEFGRALAVLGRGLGGAH